MNWTGQTDSLFNHRAEPPHRPEDVDGPTHAALLGDGSPVRTEPETPDVLEAAGLPLAARSGPPDHCPSCGVALPDPSHPVDASLRNQPPPSP